MAALDVTTVDLQLTVNNEPQPLIVADATTTTAVLPKIKPGYIVSGSATIHLADGSTRVAQLDATEAELHGVLKFKVPYNYTAYDLSNTQVSSGTYFSRDGIDLSSVTTENIAGWQCVSDGTTHNGSHVSGVRGDVDLYAVPAEGANVLTAVPDKTSLIAGSSTASDYTATITITNAASTPLVTATGYLTNDPPTRDASDPTKYTVDVRITGGASPAMFADSTTSTVNIDVGTETRSVTFTLKNKYTVNVEYTASGGGMAATTLSSQYMQGSSITFDAANSGVISTQGNRGVAAFKYGTSTVLYKTATAGATSVTINSTNFPGLTSRTINLSAVLNFDYTASGGHATGASVPAGTEADPFVLMLGSTDSELTCIDLYISDFIGTMSTTSNSGGKLTISGNNTDSPAITIASTVTAASIPAGGSKYKVTMTDSGTGATKDIYVKVTKAPTIPDFTVKITPPSSYVSTKGSPTATPPVYALANLTDTFTFEPYSAEGFPDGTTFSWDITITTSAGGTITVPTATGATCSLNLSTYVTDATIGHSASEVTDISVVCTANNIAAAVTSKTCTTPGNAKAFLLYTLPAFTISAAPTSYDANNTSTSGGVTTYALTSASTSIDLTATSSGAAFPAGTTFDWTVDGYSLTGGASQHEATVNGVGLSGLGITLSSSSATPTSIVITCTAKNANATADLDATDFTLKVFRLTIPAYKITVTPPTGIETEGSGTNTVYLVTNSDLTSTTKKFTLNVEPVDSSDSIPDGTQFTWSFDSTASTTNPRDVEIGTMCGIAAAPDTATPYTVTCTASLTGAAAPTTPATATVKLKRKIIGSKPAPDAVGDIVFTDGSAMTYEEYTALDTTTQNEKKAEVIALIFDATQKLGVGLKHGSTCHWCATGSSSQMQDISEIECTVSGSGNARTVTGDTDGSDNLEQISAFLASNAITDDTGTASMYPAFYFAKNYKDTATNLAGTEYEDGWYLPSIAELNQIYANGVGTAKLFNLNSASSTLGGGQFNNSSYWSSSQYAPSHNGAYYLSFEDGSCNMGIRFSGQSKVCAIRKFD